VLCRDEERRSRGCEEDFGPEAPLLELGAMMGVRWESVLIVTKAAGAVCGPEELAREHETYAPVGRLGCGREKAVQVCGDTGDFRHTLSGTRYAGHEFKCWCSSALLSDRRTPVSPQSLYS